jgi:hypothetical protein
MQNHYLEKEGNSNDEKVVKFFSIWFDCHIKYNWM